VDDEVASVHGLPPALASSSFSPEVLGGMDESGDMGMLLALHAVWLAPIMNISCAKAPVTPTPPSASDPRQSGAAVRYDRMHEAMVDERQRVKGCGYAEWGPNKTRRRIPPSSFSPWYLPLKQIEFQALGDGGGRRPYRPWRGSRSSRWPPPCRSLSPGWAPCCWRRCST